MEGIITSLLALWIMIAGFAVMVGGQKAAGSVFAAPLRFGGWCLRGLLSAAGRGAWSVFAAIGRGIAELMADAHRHLYGRWPGVTLLGYAAVLLATGLYIYLR